MKESPLLVRLTDEGAPTSYQADGQEEPPLPVRLMDEGAPTSCPADGQNHQLSAQSPDLWELISLGCGLTVCLGVTCSVGIGSGAVET